MKTITTTQQQEIRKAVKRFNSKVDYWNKKDPKNVKYRPGKMNAKAVIANIGSANDYKNTLKILNAYSKKGAEKIITNKEGVKAAAWFKTAITNNISRINTQNAKIGKKVDTILPPGYVFYDSVATPRVKLQHSKLYDKVKFSFDTLPNIAAVKDALRTTGLKQSDKRFNYRMNGYSKMVLNGYSYNLNDDEIRVIEDIFNSVPSEIISTLYFAGYEQIEPEFFYDLDDWEAAGYTSRTSYFHAKVGQIRRIISDALQKNSAKYKTQLILACKENYGDKAAKELEKILKNTTGKRIAQLYSQNKPEVTTEFFQSKTYVEPWEYDMYSAAAKRQYNNNRTQEGLKKVKQLASIL